MRRMRLLALISVFVFSKSMGGASEYLYVENLKEALLAFLIAALLTVGVFIVVGVFASGLHWLGGFLDVTLANYGTKLEEVCSTLLSRLTK